MSEQQFALDKLYYSIMTPIEKISVGRNYITYGEVVDLLNEQQATITHLEKVNGKNFAKRRLLEQDNLVLRNEKEQLRQIMNDIVVATDETYTKNASVFKVTVVLDFEKYMEIKRCIE